MAQRRQAQHETEVFALETGMLERGPQRRLERWFAIDAVDRQLAARAVLGQAPQRAERWRGELVEGRQRDQAFATALDIQGWLAVDEHDVGPGAALELLRFWPGERGAIRVGRIGGGQQVHVRGF